MDFAIYVLIGVALALSFLCVALLLPSAGRSPFAKDSRRPRQAIVTDPEARRAVLKFGFTEDRVPTNLDVVIVGSGVGGLLAGALLTKAGKRVAVFEQHDQAGGCLHTFFEDGFEFDTGIHYIGEMLSKSNFRALVDQATEGQIAWAPLDPVYDIVRPATRSACGYRQHSQNPHSFRLLWESLDPKTLSAWASQRDATHLPRVSALRFPTRDGLLTRSCAGSLKREQTWRALPS